MKEKKNKKEKKKERDKTEKVRGERLREYAVTPPPTPRPCERDPSCYQYPPYHQLSHT